jgi:hypothetical protein
VPDTALLGETITIMLRGNGCSDSPFTSPDGLVLQIPLGTQVIGTDGLTQDDSLTAGYTAESGYQLWGGKQNTGPSALECGGVGKNITLKIHDTVMPGTYYIKAAVRSYANGEWTNVTPGPTNFALISGAYQSNMMSIITTGIAITSPNGGENWYAGGTQTIGWIYRGDVGQTVDIALYESSNPFTSLAVGVSIGSNGNGVYDWPIPLDFVNSNVYQIKITSSSNGSFSDLSSDFFSLKAPNIQVSEPRLGKSVYNDLVNRVQWTFEGIDYSTVNIELYKGGTLHSTVATNVSVGSDGSGYYDWFPSAAAATDYQIKVVSNMHGIVSSLSDPYFVIADCPNNKVSMHGGYYDSIQSAYNYNDKRIIGVRDIYAQAGNFPAGLLLDHDKTVTIYGGFDCSYQYVDWFTTIQGVMTISRGSATVNELIIAP